VSGGAAAPRPTGPGELLRRAPWWVLAAIAIELAYAVVLVVPGAADALGVIANAAVWVVRSAVQAAALWWAARRPDAPARLRTGLGIAAAAAALTTAVRISGLVTAAITGAAVDGAILDAVQLVAYTATFVGMLRMPAAPSRPGEWHTIALDLIVSVGGLGALAWVVVTIPQAQTSGEATYVLLYGVSELAMLAGLNVLVVRGAAWPSRRAVGLYVAGHVVFLPLMVLVQYVSKYPELGAATWVLYFAGGIVILLAAVAFRTDPAVASPPPRLLPETAAVNPLPVLSPIVIGAFLVAAALAGGHDAVAALAIIATLVSLALVVRVVVTSRAHARAVARAAELDRRLHRDKLAAIGQLAGGIAHEYNNVLATVIATAELGQEDAASPESRSDFATIQRAATRAAALTRQLLMFSGRQANRVAPLDLAALVTRLRPVIEASAPPRVALRFELPAGASAGDGAEGDGAAVHGDADALADMVTRLASNAIDAAAGGPAAGAAGGLGHVDVAVRAVALAHGLESRFLPVAAGRYVVLEVTDDGGGISASDLPHLFEPFFTRKVQHPGGGLGLSTVYGAIVAHRGGVVVDSAPGRGTRIRVYLPAA
jgi:signal transduction histidine kinase